jgi:uncharacterized protein YcfJ
MIDVRQPVRRSSFSREMSVIPALSGGIIIKSAGEPLSGTVSSTVNGAVAGPTTGTDCTEYIYIK